MEEIRNKKLSGSLRHVTEEKKARPPLDTRGELLDQIRSGVVLKKVDLDSFSAGASSSSSEAPGIAGLLQKALQERTAALCQSSSSDEGDEEEDEEWD